MTQVLLTKLNQVRSISNQLFSSIERIEKVY